MTEVVQKPAYMTSYLVGHADPLGLGLELVQSLLTTGTQSFPKGASRLL